MTLGRLDEYIRSVLEIDALAAVDSSLNGIQVGDSSASVAKIAFAVDAALETIQRAADWGADALFVHHGLFWGREQTITGDHYRRIKLLIDSSVALYATHLPLDKHETLGNNGQMAVKLGLTDVRPFGEYKGVQIGVAGRLPDPTSTDEIARTLFGSPDAALAILPFGNQENESVAIVSGGAPYEVDQAIAGGYDLYITGDASHTIYHRCLEAAINVIFGGHYQTETWGPRAIMEKLKSELDIETRFIEVPTGL